VSNVDSIGRAVLSLALVVFVMWLLGRWARGRGRKRTRSRHGLEVLARQQLTRNASVAVVRIGDTARILGVTDSHVSLLGEVDAGQFDAGQFDAADLDAAQLDAAPVGIRPRDVRRSDTLVDFPYPQLAEVPVPAPVAAATALPTPLPTPLPARGATGRPSGRPATFAGTGAAPSPSPRLSPSPSPSPSPRPSPRSGAAAGRRAARASHRRGPVRALEGSALSLTTWTDAVNVLRERTVRR
jgi:flagellar protein FliO/FliZ